MPILAAWVVITSIQWLGDKEIPLPAFKAPKQIVLSAALPKTERGKLNRRALAERWKQSEG